jgi:CRP-like cAMP-binding protein
MCDHLFDDLPEPILKILKANEKLIKYKKGQLIFHEGAYATGIYYVKKGMVKKYTLGFEGREHIFYLCNEGELLGYHALLSNEPYSDSAETIEDSEIVFIPKDDFLKALNESHQLTHKILKSLSHEFGFFILSTKILSQYTVRERTALALLILEEKFQNHTDGAIYLRRDDLAGIIGTAKETLIRVLHEFKEDGYIVVNKRPIIIKDRQALIEISNYF